MNRICLVEDCVDLQELVKLELRHWYDVTCARNVEEALSLIQKSKFDLILLDVTLPDGSGFELCSKLKNAPTTAHLPIIFLTGKSEPMDKMLGFSTGADDYVSKPFEPIELRARIEARLKKTEQKTSENFGLLRFDRIKQRAVRVHEGQDKDLGLTPFEFRLLYFLASHSGEVFNRVAILKNILEENVHVNDENIYTHISSLRRKLGDCADYIECIPRVGYRFNLPE